MIKRAVFREYIDGPGMSFNDVVLKDYAHEYAASVTVDELHERPHGVCILRNGTPFTVPWSSVKFTQGLDVADVDRIAREWADGFDERHPSTEEREAQQADETLKAGMVRAGENLAQTMDEAATKMPLSDAPKTNARPCPVCVGVEEAHEKAGEPSKPVIPNHRSRVSFLCEEHAIPENVKLFRKEKP